MFLLNKYKMSWRKIHGFTPDPKLFTQQWLMDFNPELQYDELVLKLYPSSEKKIPNH